MKYVVYSLFSFFLIICLVSLSLANNRQNREKIPVSIMEENKPISPEGLYYLHLKKLLKAGQQTQLDLLSRQQKISFTRGPDNSFKLRPPDGAGHLLKTNESTSLLDSVKLKAQGHFYRYINTYDENNRIKTELTQTSLDSASDNWLDTLRVTYDYDVSGNLTVWMIEVWNQDSLKWLKSTKYDYKYNTNGKLIESVYSIGSNENEWLNYFKTENTYKSDGNLVSSLTQSWDAISQSWINSYVLTNTYDDNGYLVLALFQYWDSSSEQWLNSSQESYTYYADGNLETTVSSYWGGDDWVYTSRVTLFYDSTQVTNLKIAKRSTGLLQWYTKLQEKHDNVTNKWEKYSKEEREYNDKKDITKSTYSEFNKESNDWEFKKRLSMTYTEAFGDFNSKLLSAETQKWVMDEQGSRWQNENLTKYDYDTKGNLTSQVYQEWDLGLSAYVDKNKIQLTYNEENLPINFYSFENMNGIWSPKDTYVDIQVGINYFVYYGYELDAYYSTTTSLETPATDLPNGYALSQNFPNPFNPGTTIRYAIGQKEMVKLEIFNVLGQKVATLINNEQPAGKHTIYFDASALVSGVYYFRLKTDHYSKTKRMILLR